MQVILGAHRFLVNIIETEEDGPTRKVLMKIFRPFIPQKSIKDYIFRRTQKSLLLELVLCILQDVAQNGISRLASLNLVIEKTRAGGKNVVVEPQSERPDNETIENDEFMKEIDEIFFLFQDKEGNSPDIKFAAGAGRPPPSYSPPDGKGNFVTPKKRGNPKELFSLGVRVRGKSMSLLFFTPFFEERSAHL